MNQHVVRDVVYTYKKTLISRLIGNLAPQHAAAGDRNVVETHTYIPFDCFDGSVGRGTTQFLANSYLILKNLSDVRSDKAYFRNPMGSASDGKVSDRSCIALCRVVNQAEMNSNRVFAV